MVAASSALLRLNGIGAALSPVLVGGLIARFGPPAYFGSLAGLTGLLCIYDQWRKMRRRPPPPERKQPFGPAQEHRLGAAISYWHNAGQFRMARRSACRLRTCGRRKFTPLRRHPSATIFLAGVRPGSEDRACQSSPSSTCAI